MSEGRGCGDELFVNKSNLCLHGVRHLSTDVSRANTLTDVCAYTHTHTHTGAPAAQSEEQQEAVCEFVARLNTGDIHVAAQARASKSRSFWCGFTEIHQREI